MFDYEMISQQCLTMPAKGYLFREPSCFNAFGYISCGWFTRPVHMVSSIICKPKTGHKVKIFAYPLSIFPHSLVKTLAPRHTHMHHAKSLGSWEPFLSPWCKVNKEMRGSIQVRKKIRMEQTKRNDDVDVEVVVDNDMMIDGGLPGPIQCKADLIQRWWWIWRVDLVAPKIEMCK